MSHGMTNSDDLGGRQSLQEKISITGDGPIIEKSELPSDSESLKTAQDGHTILVPQPTDDPNDPLNWSSRKKHMMLAVISAVAFLPDYGSSLGSVTVIPQSAQWNLPDAIIQHNLVGNLFTLGAGGLFAVALADYFGRLPTLLFFQTMAFCTGIWCAVAQNFASFEAARIVNGFFAIIAEAGGLMWIKDMFFYHEHPRKINLWSGPVIVAPYLGPFTAAFVLSAYDWRDAFWVYTALTGFGLILVVVLAEETFYDRRLSRDQQPSWRSRWKRLCGIERHSCGSFVSAISRPFIAVTKVPVMFIIVYYFLNFAWIIGVNATIATWLSTYYKFDYVNLGVFYVAPIVGAILGEVAGHWLHDMNGRFYARRNGGRITPEIRLNLCYLGSIFMGCGVLLVGLTFQKHWHYIIAAVFAAMQVSGIMIATVAVNSYLLDSYPEGSGEVCAWINVARTQGGFMAVYIEIPWVLTVGPGKVLGIQAGITFAAALCIIFLQIFGKKIRQTQGPMIFPGDYGPLIAHRLTRPEV